MMKKMFIIVGLLAAVGCGKKEKTYRQGYEECVSEMRSEVYRGCNRYDDGSDGIEDLCEHLLGYGSPL